MKKFLTADENWNLIASLEQDIQDLKEILESEPERKIERNMLSRREQMLEKLPKNSHEFIFFGHPDEKGNPKVTLNMSDCTFIDNRGRDGRVIFLTGRFKDGMLLGFWSENPWGTTKNQDRGWAIINPEEMEVVEELEISCMGSSVGNNFAEWRKEMKSQHGKLTLFIDMFGNRVWKMTEA